MIWVIAGTQDGRELAAKVTQEVGANQVVITVVSSYGKLLAEQAGADVVVGRLTQSDMERMIADKKIRLVVDASHPYAAIVSETARAACRAAGVQYVRYERPETPLPAYEKLHHVPDESSAAALAGELGDRIYLTTGSKTLATFIHAPALQGKEVWSRVLPTTEVVSMCEELGLTPKYIVGVQGPFSYEMNRAMFHDTDAQVVVMKNSGLVGGTDTKLQAAIDENLEIIVIDRPPTSTEDFVKVNAVDDVMKYWREHNGLH